jgi:tripartite ATP-independent transporter DctM subunit
MGGLFAGIFTASEAGAIGAFGAFVLMIGKRKMNRKSLWESLKPSITTTCFILTITIGAMIFTNFLTIAGFSSMFADWITGLSLPPTIIMIFILFIYLPLGCVMDSLAMVLLTVPIVFPIVTALGYDPVWFGIMIGILSEAGLLTPPVGMNSFVVHGVTKVPLHIVFKGIIPFFLMMVVCCAILFVFPQIATFLPSIMK